MLKRLFNWLAGSAPRQPQPRRLQLESLETRLTPTNWVVVAPNAGVEGRVEVWDTAPNQPATLFGRFRPFNGFTNGLRIAVGDTDGDNMPEVFVAPGPNGPAQVAQYRFDGVRFSLVQTINVIPGGTFRPGLTLAVGDVSGDATPELIVSNSKGGGSNATVYVFDTSTVPARRLQQFAATGLGTTGARVTTADINNDGKQDIIAAPETGTSPTIRVFRGGPTLVNTAALTINITGFVGMGMNISSGNLDGVGGQDLIISPNSAVGNTNRKIFFARFNTTLTPIVTSTAQAASLYPNGIRVAGFDFNGNGISDIATIAAVNGPRKVRVLSPGGVLLTSFDVGTYLPATRKPGFDIAAITF